MNGRSRKKIIRLLGVGFDNEDGHIRITQGENYDVMMGSAESHEYMQQLIEKIEQRVFELGKTLEEISPDELVGLVEEVRTN